MLIEVETAADERLADYVRLRETTLRKHLEAEHGLFIAEGEKVIRRAVEAGYRPRSFMLAPRWLPGLADVLAKWPQTPVYVVSEQLAEEVTGFHVHRGALAALRREIRHTPEQLLANARRLVVLEDIVDHANVGAVLRNAAGLGWDGALLAPRAADPLYRRAIKVSMGSVFTLPWARLSDWAGTPELLRAAGFTTIALTLAADAIDLATVSTRLGVGLSTSSDALSTGLSATSDAPAAGDEQGAESAPRNSRVAILLGTEGAGLSQRWSEGADLRAVIPMRPGIDSLNVAAASAIACYALGWD